VRVLLEAGAEVAQEDSDGRTALMAASEYGHLECVRALLEAGAEVAQASTDGWTALMAASEQSHVECVHALLEAGADVLQLHDDGPCALEYACESLEMLQLLCAYAPSREQVRAHTMREDFEREDFELSPECAQWLEATSRWTSPLHHFEFLPIERVRALLVAGGDVHASDGGANAPTPLSLTAARLLAGDRANDGRAALIASAAAPWSPATHALFPAGAKARAVELLRLGWLLARHLQCLIADTTEVEVAFLDVWLGHVMPQAVER
jgi:hypothetical protein